MAFNSPRIVRATLMAEVGWTDEARAAAALARKRGWEKRPSRDPDAPHHFTHPDFKGHGLEIDEDGSWDHVGPMGGGRAFGQRYGMHGSGDDVRSLDDHLASFHGKREGREDEGEQYSFAGRAAGMRPGADLYEQEGTVRATLVGTPGDEAAAGSALAQVLRGEADVSRGASGEISDLLTDERTVHHDKGLGAQDQRDGGELPELGQGPSDEEPGTGRMPAKPVQAEWYRGGDEPESPHDDDEKAHDVPTDSFVDDVKRKLSIKRVMPGGDSQDMKDQPAGQKADEESEQDVDKDQRGVPVPQEPVWSKEEVNYRYASDPQRSCGDCRFFTEPASCRLVMGMILKTDTCDRFEAEKQPGSQDVRATVYNESGEPDGRAVLLREVGWTDEARAAARLARQKGYKKVGQSSKLGAAMEHPGTGHTLHLLDDGSWIHSAPPKPGKQGRSEIVGHQGGGGLDRLGRELDRVHGTGQKESQSGGKGKVGAGTVLLGNQRQVPQTGKRVPALGFAREKDAADGGPARKWGMAPGGTGYQGMREYSPDQPRDKGRFTKGGGSQTSAASAKNPKLAAKLAAFRDRQAKLAALRQKNAPADRKSQQQGRGISQDEGRQIFQKAGAARGYKENAMREVGWTDEARAAAAAARKAGFKKSHRDGRGNHVYVHPDMDGELAINSQSGKWEHREHDPDARRVPDQYGRGRGSSVGEYMADVKDRMGVKEGSMRETWSDAARAASALARRHGYEHRDTPRKGQASVMDHPNGSTLKVYPNGHWMHSDGAGDQVRGVSHGGFAARLKQQHGEPDAGPRPRYREAAMREAGKLPFFAKHKNGEAIGMSRLLDIKRGMEAIGYESPLGEVSPPGWEGTVKAMKKSKGIDNPWALAWYMKGKGYQPHKEMEDEHGGMLPPEMAKTARGQLTKGNREQATALGDETPAENKMPPRHAGQAKGYALGEKEGSQVKFPGKRVHFEPHKPHKGELDHPIHGEEDEALERRAKREADVIRKTARRLVRENDFAGMRRLDVPMRDSSQQKVREGDRYDRRPYDNKFGQGRRG